MSLSHPFNLTSIDLETIDTTSMHNKPTYNADKLGTYKERPRAPKSAKARRSLNDHQVNQVKFLLAYSHVNVNAMSKFYNTAPATIHSIARQSSYRDHTAPFEDINRGLTKTINRARLSEYFNDNYEELQSIIKLASK